MIQYPFIASLDREVPDPDAADVVGLILASAVRVHKAGDILACTSCGVAMEPHEIGALAIRMNGCCLAHFESVLFCFDCAATDRETLRLMLVNRCIANNSGLS